MVTASNPVCSNVTDKDIMGDPVDPSQIFFTNLLLLGFDAAAMERKHRIPFNKDMFLLPNKKGFEIVTYFLFSRLNGTKCKEMYRDCWPVCDKKQEQMFRGVCHSWLTEIVQEDADAVLPRIVASTFMSPGGRKFVELLMYFSVYVLMKVSQNENGVKRRDCLRHPVVTSQSQSSGLANVMDNVIQTSVIRLRTKFLAHVKQTCVVQERWKNYAIEQVKLYRSLTKARREKERQLRTLLNQAAEQGAERGSPVPTRRKSGILQYDYDIQNVKRAQKVQKVRALWHSLDQYSEATDKDQKIVNSILDGSLDQYKVDASELNVKVPDLLLRQCEQEIHRRGVENIYVGGKLNLLSLIQLWNLSLHLYIDKLGRAGVPNFDNAYPTLKTEVHSHHANLNDLQSLRLKLEKEVLPQIKESVKTMKTNLEKEFFKNKSPESVRTTSLGLAFLPETPPVNFEPDESGTPGTSSVFKVSPEQVSTPDAVAKLISDISQKVKAKQTDHESSPLYDHRRKRVTQSRMTSRLPVYGDVQIEKVGNKHRTQTKKKQPSLFDTRSQTEGVSLNGRNITLLQTLTENTKQGLPGVDNTQISELPGKRIRNQDPDDNTDHQRSKTKHVAEAVYSDMLADKIAEDMVNLSLERNEQDQEIDFLQNTIGHIERDTVSMKDKTEVSRQIISHRTWNDSLLHDSIGPLSSTHMDHSTRIGISKAVMDPLVTKLFTQATSGSKDGMIATKPGGVTEVAKTVTYNRPHLERVRAASPLGDNLPSSISSISPQSDRSSTKASDKRQSTLINELELDKDEEHTLPGESGHSAGDLDHRSGERLTDHLKVSDTSVQEMRETRLHTGGSLCNDSMNSTSSGRHSDEKSASDLEDSVRVIEFQNGSFNEFLDNSPQKAMDKSLKGHHKPGSSHAKSELQAIKEKLDQTTESLLAEYQQLANEVKSPERCQQSGETFLTEKDVVRGGATFKPLPLISQTPTMSFLESYLKCSPPPGKYGNMTLTDNSQSCVVRKLTLDWDSDDDDDGDGEAARTPQGASTTQMSSVDKIHNTFTAHSGTRPSEQNRKLKHEHFPADSLSFPQWNEMLYGDDEGIMSETPMFVSDEPSPLANTAYGTQQTPVDDSVSPEDVRQLNLSAIRLSPFTDKLHRPGDRSELNYNLLDEDTSCLIQDSPGDGSQHVGKLVDI